MSEKAPEQARQPEGSHIDMEFSSAVSRWFNGYKEDLLKTTDDKDPKTQEENQNFAYYQNTLKEQLSTLAAPQRLESKIRRDGTAGKFGESEARGMYTAEGMAMLGQQMASLDELQREYEDPNSAMVKEITASLIERAKEAKKLFMAASEKVFTPSEIQNLGEEARDIAEAYERMNLGSDDGSTADLGADFEHLSQSTKNPHELKQALANVSQRLGESLGREVWHLTQDTDELSPEREDRRHLVMAANNKLLYRLEKVKEKIGS